MKIRTRFLVTLMSIVTLSLLLLIIAIKHVFNQVIPNFHTTIKSLTYEESVTVKITKYDILGLGFDITVVLIVILVFVLLISIFIAIRTSRYITSPIKKLNSGVQRVANNDFSKPIYHNKNDEFKPVIDTFNHLQLQLINEKEKNDIYEKARIDMISGISHDLRTPLTSIKGFIKGIKDGVATTPEKQQQYLDIAYKKTEEIENLLNQLLAISNMEVGEIALNRKNTQIDQLIKNWLREFSSEFEGITFSFITTGKIAYANIDKEYFYRIFQNIINNSIKYSNAGKLHITIEQYVDNEKVKLTIKDNGSGIATEYLGTIFNQFWRGDNARTFSKNSSGLGLYIVKQIIELHSGSVRAYNDNGLAIEITLPLGEEEND